MFHNYSRNEIPEVIICKFTILEGNSDTQCHELPATFCLIYAMHYRSRSPIVSRWLPTNLQDITEIRYGKLSLSESDRIEDLCVVIKEK